MEGFLCMTYLRRHHVLEDSVVNVNEYLRKFL